MNTTRTAEQDRATVRQTRYDCWTVYRTTASGAVFADSTYATMNGACHRAAEFGPYVLDLGGDPQDEAK